MEHKETIACYFANEITKEKERDKYLTLINKAKSMAVNKIYEHKYHNLKLLSCLCFSDGSKLEIKYYQNGEPSKFIEIKKEIK